MSNLVSVADVDVHVEGEGAETIIMVHGWPDTYRVWDAQVQGLKSRYRCVRFTLPGFDAAKARVVAGDRFAAWPDTARPQMDPRRP